MAVAVRPFAIRDTSPVGDVLFVAARERAAHTGRPPAFDVPAAARRFVQRLLEVDPVGAHVAESEGEVVAVGWVHPRGRVATLGPLAVLPGQRGHGVGTRVLNACLTSVGERGVQVRVVEDGGDAAMMGLLFHHGFRVATSVLELERAPDGGGPPLLAPGLAVRELGASDEADLVARDTRLWGAARPQDVAALLAHGRGAVLERRERAVAHAMARRGERAVTIGPAAGEDAAQVASLVGWLAAAYVETPLPARVLLGAGDQRLVEALLGQAFRVRAVLQYLVRGGGTAPPPGYVLASRMLA